MRKPVIGTAALTLWLGLSMAAAAHNEELALPTIEPSVPAEHAPAAAGGQHHSVPSLERRIAAYTRMLALTPTQQAELRTLLLQQRAEVRRLWSNASVPAGDRILRTRAIGDATADRIRAMLNEEQRAKYNAPRAPRTDNAQATGMPNSVEDWMSAAGAR